jgi:predicted CoA-substrate-specific enzyme activase
MVVAGIDIGSTTTKSIILDEGGTMIGTAVELTGADMNRASEEVLDESLSQTGYSRKDIEYIVSTGYGRNGIDWKDESIPEIIAIATGGQQLLPEVKTIVDIGGQDSKAIALGNRGMVKKFLMNDRCAAGTGRFLETIARVLNMPLGQMIQKGLTFKNPVDIDSTCVVFAESEVVTKLSQKLPVEDIIAGVHFSVIKRIAPLIRQVGLAPPLMFSGGGAKNDLAARMIEIQFNIKPYVYENPQIVCALGAAVKAYEKANNGRRG